MTVQVRMVMDAVQEHRPVWGYRVCQLTGLGPGTVYPILERLQEAGWIAAETERQPPPDRPGRRYLTVTPQGRERYAQALASRPRHWRRKGRA